MFFKEVNARIKLILLVIVILIILIFFKVLYIEIFNNKSLSIKTNNLWSLDLPVEAERGKILDRNGEVFATSVTSGSVAVVPSEIKNKKYVTKKLSEILGCSYDKVKKHVFKHVSIERIHPEGRRLSKSKIKKINDLNMKGVYILKESKRYYPNKKMLSHVLGFVGIDNQGLSGIEKQYNKYLSGEDGAIKFYVNSHGNKIPINDKYIEPTNGLDISLTIDINIQRSIERELDNVMMNFEPDNALAIVVDPNTLEILGISSRPNFDPNNYKKYDIKALSRNLPIWATYEPGSTQKVVTMAASINEGIIDINKDKFYDSGSVMIGGSKIKCWKSHGHGEQTFMEVLQNSCNPGFVRLGNLLGKERLFSYLDKFGFGYKTGINLSGEGSGIIFPLNKVRELELATTAFGQGISVTPIQQVTAFSAVVNGGYLLRPYITSRIMDSNTHSTIKKYNKKIRRKVIKKNTSLIMRGALENVVSKGGGKAAFIEDYRIGGKTGTAQKQENGRYLFNNYIMSFIAVVPANDPKAVLYIAIDNPKHTPNLSSYTTTPVARRILLDIIDTLKIRKQKGEVPKDLEWNDIILKEVPNVIGDSRDEAIKKLSDFNILYTGNGDLIAEQSPVGGTKIPINSNVRLYLN